MDTPVPDRHESAGMEPQASPDSSNASAASAASAFGLLHPGVQRQLWRMGWKSLRPLQVDAIHAILRSEKHVILSAATASGKTEAAFLPILSRIAPEPTGSVRVMYIGPLKALINDQFTRVGDLCANLDVPVYHWHGDVSAREKARLVEQPGGVLLITPESLESLFVNRSEHLAGLFGGLRFVIIDELHSFLDNERGLHLRSLLSRVRQLMAELPDSVPYRVAALSATIGDHALGQRFVAPEKPDEVLVITDKAGEKALKYRVHGYSLPVANEVDDDEEADEPSEPGEDDWAEEPGEEVHDEPEPQEQGNADKPREAPFLPMLQDMAADIVRHCAGHSNLVFANSRADVEVFADLAKRIAQQQRLVYRQF